LARRSPRAISITRVSGEDGDLMANQIWESPETFEAFGSTLMPILAELDIDADEPSITPLQRLEQTSNAP
jgi:hypothetical protein